MSLKVFRIGFALGKEMSLFRSLITTRNTLSSSRVINHHLFKQQYRCFSQQNKSLLKASSSNNNGKKGFTANDFRLALICIAMVSIAVGAYYSNKSTERKFEYKEKVREERKQSVENMKENAKEFFGRLRKKKTSEKEENVDSEVKKD